MKLYRQNGAALVVSLILLLGLTLIGLSSMSSSIMQEKMASNYRQEDLAFQSATSALRWGEFWLLGKKSRPETSECLLLGGGCDPTTDAVLAQGSFVEMPPESLDKNWWNTQTREFGRLYEDWGDTPAGSAWALPGLAAQPRYVVEEMARVKFGSGLEGADMVQNYIFVYRVAASGVGEVDTGAAVIESHFIRRYGSN